MSRTTSVLVFKILFLTPFFNKLLFYIYHLIILFNLKLKKGLIVQWLEHDAHNVVAAGSTPAKLIPRTLRTCCAKQLLNCKLQTLSLVVSTDATRVRSSVVEHRAFNLMAAGSTPAVPNNTHLIGIIVNCYLKALNCYVKALRRAKQGVRSTSRRVTTVLWYVTVTCCVMYPCNLSNTA